MTEEAMISDCVTQFPSEFRIYGFYLAKATGSSFVVTKSDPTILSTHPANALPSRADDSGNRESRTQNAGLVGIIERNFHGDSLYHLCEIAGRIVGRQ